MEMNRNILIAAGNTLTITSTIQFGENKHIVVKNGAKLHLDGGTLTKCSLVEDWGGIRVEGNSVEEQPNAFGPPVIGKAGIVLMTNNARVEWARTAISTSKFDEHWNSAYWGGLIHCENTTFSYNGRVAEFMKYNKTNQSKFTDCTMEASGIGYTGVTIWDTDGVTFNGCSFYDMGSQGILTFDAGAIVKDGNTFSGNNRGIISRASYPFAAFMEIGGTGEPNHFFNNRVHIESEASNKLDGLKIINNEFSKSNAAIRLNGPSKFFILNNSIDQTTVGIHSFATGALQNNQNNYISNNDISGSFGLNVMGENRELQFLCNDFSIRYFDIRLQDRNGAIGEIRSKQGSPNQPAGNCFTDPGQVLDIVTSGVTNGFDYYAYGVKKCHTPLNPGDYNVFFAFGEGCVDAVVGGFSENPTMENYTNIKDQISAINDNGGQPEGQLAGLLEEKEHILLSLLGGYIKAGKTESAIDLLDTENTVSSQLMKYGVLVDAGHYTDAQKALDALPDEVPEMATFKQIQAINLARLQQGLAYQLSEGDALFLESIATSDIGIKAYARSVLYILRGREFFDEFTIEEGDGGIVIDNNNSNLPTIPQQENDGFTVFPNPTDGKFTVSVADGVSVPALRITDAYGQPVYEQAFQEGIHYLEVDGGSWQEGMYIVQFLGTDANAIGTKKVFIKK